MRTSDLPQTLPPPLVPDHFDEEALFPEARRLRRRRWVIGALAVALVLGIAGLLVAVLAGGGRSPVRGSVFVSSAPAAGALTTLHVAGALAVGPGGDLYVADVPESPAKPAALAADRVLVRLPDGRFRVVASNLPGISDLAFAPDGTLYIAEAGWVRMMSPDGEIHTVAGDGRTQPFSHSTRYPQNIAAGTLARSAPLGSIRTRAHSPLHIAFAPDGQLYISTGTQILRLTAAGALEPVRAVAAPSHSHPAGQAVGQLTEVGAIAIGPDETIYAGTVFRGWTLWDIARDGTAHYLAYARQSGGSSAAVQRGPNGTVYTEMGDKIQVIQDGEPKTVFEFRRKIADEPFGLTNFAIAPNGVIYADEIPGNDGLEAHQQLVAVHDARTSLLWQERNHAPH